MKIDLFKVEDWMNRYETKAVYNLAETCVHSLTLRELLNYDTSKPNALEKLMDQRLTYGDITGNPVFKEELSALYSHVSPDQILTTHGAIGANQLALLTLVEPGDHVIVAVPTYQQLYAIPEAIGAKVDRLELLAEEAFLPNLEKLKALVTPETKLIVLNNPNNPTGALISEDMLQDIVNMARENDAWLLCDEVYRGMQPRGSSMVPSVVDMYEKGVATGSLSKIFSLAGLRLGWVVGPAPFIQDCFHQRDYSTISCSMVDEALGMVAVKNRHKVWERNLGMVNANLDIIDEWVKNEPRVSYVKPKAGTTAFLKIESQMFMEDFCIKLMEETGTMLVPGTCFEREGYVRMGYVCDEETLRKGLKEISSFLQKHPDIE